MERSRNAQGRRVCCSTHYDRHARPSKEKSPAFPPDGSRTGANFRSASKSPVFNFRGLFYALPRCAQTFIPRDRGFGSRKASSCVPPNLWFVLYRNVAKRRTKLKKETKSRYGRKKKKGSTLVCGCVLWVCMRSTNPARSEKRASPSFLPGCGLEEGQTFNCKPRRECKESGATQNHTISSGSAGDGDKKPKFKSNLTMRVRFTCKRSCRFLPCMPFCSVTYRGTPATPSAAQ